MSVRRSRHPLLAGVLAAVATGHVADAVVLRRRRGQLPVIDAAGAGASRRPAVGGGAPAGDERSEPGAAATRTGGSHPPDAASVAAARSASAGDVRSITAHGVTLPDAVQAGAAAHAAATGRAVVDLVPGDLPAEDALALLRRVDPAHLAERLSAGPGGAHQALVVTHDLAGRAGLTSGEPDPARSPAAMVRATRALQRAAGRAGGIAVAPGLRAAPPGPDHGWATRDALLDGRPYASLAAAVVVIEGAHLAMLAGGVLLAPWSGAAALAAWWVKPALVGAPFGWPRRVLRAGSVAEQRPEHTEGGDGRAPRAARLGAGPVASGAGLPPPEAVRPRQRPASSAPPAPSLVGDAPRRWAPPDVVAATLQRPLVRARRIVGGGRAGVAANRSEITGRRRAPAHVPDPATLFAARREGCPWCGSGDLELRLETTDLLQHKPGRFRLDACGACGHVFQNPQLNADGLAFYYDQFYDGIAGELMEQLFAGADVDNERRIRTLSAAGVRPSRLLDVGTGHGHFCLAARDRWPEATFDGLDRSASVDEAARRGWIDRAHNGPLPDLAGGLAGYDVVTMHHYLEHTVDPRAELDAAVKVLEPGGVLEIEGPDPECWLNRPLGRWWLPWLQPQHLNFVPAGNLVDELRARNFEIVTVVRDEHQAVEMSAALALRLEHLVPSGRMPWRPPPTLARQVGRGAVMTAALPAFALAWVADQALAKLAPHVGPTNIYRIVARRL